MKRMTSSKSALSYRPAIQRLIGRACMGGWCKGHHGSDQTETHESLQNNFAGHRYHSHPAADEGPGRNDRGFTSN